MVINANPCIDGQTTSRASTIALIEGDRVLLYSLCIVAFLFNRSLPLLCLFASEPPRSLAFGFILASILLQTLILSR